MPFTVVLHEVNNDDIVDLTFYRERVAPNCLSTHQGLNKMVDILQTTLSNARASGFKVYANDSWVIQFLFKTMFLLQVWNMVIRLSHIMHQSMLHIQICDMLPEFYEIRAVSKLGKIFTGPTF